LLGSAASSSADEGRLPPPGATVRLAVDGQAVRLVGRLVSADPDKLVLRPSGGKESRPFPRDTIAAVDVATRRPLLGFGAGVLAGATGGLLLSTGTHEGALGSAAAGAILALPPAAIGAALGARERAVALGALTGAAVDGVTLGILLDGWCRAIAETGGTSGCFVGAALLGGAFGAVAGGTAAHVSRRHWTRAWSRAAQVSVLPARGKGVGVVVRLSF
jgi:hypothetical protein